MPKKLILFFVSAIFFSSCHLAFASLFINEIFYSPASKEWVEIYNDTNSDVDITQYKILDAGASVTGHAITPAVTGGSNIIPAHAYGVVAKDVTSVSATYLFHASLGINPTSSASDSVVLKNGSSAIDTVAVPYNSAINGNSLQLISSIWTNATPTPGATNVTQTSSSASSSAPVGNGTLVYDNSTNSTSNTPPETKTKTSEDQKIKTQITLKNMGFVGIPLSMQAKTYGTHAEIFQFGKYFWNFGDGDSKEGELSEAQSVSHTYFYPGEYVITLDYFSSQYSNTPDASTQIKIKIISADVIISRVGDEKDFFVELENNTDYNTDISNYFLTSDTKSFQIPRNTILDSKNKIVISSHFTHFSVDDKDSLKLLTPDGGVAFDYSQNKNSPLEEYPKGEVDSASTPSRKRATPQEGNNLKKEIPIENLPASVVQSEENQASNSHTTTFFIASMIFVGSGAGAVYFIRRKRVNFDAGNDFEILDE